MEDIDQVQNQYLEITINHKGVDLLTVVTMEEANILMNDEAATAEYAEALLTQQDRPVVAAAAPSNTEIENVKAVDCLKNTEKNMDNSSTREATGPYGRR